MPGIRSLIRRPVTWIVLTAGAVAAVAALALFQPWKLWVDQTVNEALPPVHCRDHALVLGYASAGSAAGRLGRMFRFNRNRLVGSYLSLRATSRAYLASPYPARTRSGSAVKMR
jgi:hypothetical protein